MHCLFKFLLYKPKQKIFELVLAVGEKDFQIITYQSKTKPIVPKAICCFCHCSFYPRTVRIMKYGAVWKSYSVRYSCDLRYAYTLRQKIRGGVVYAESISKLNFTVILPFLQARSFFRSVIEYTREWLGSNPLEKQTGENTTPYLIPKTKEVRAWHIGERDQIFQDGLVVMKGMHGTEVASESEDYLT